MTPIKIPCVDINKMACFCHTSKNGGRHSRNGPLIEPDLGKIEEKPSSTHAMELPESETQNLNCGYSDPSLFQRRGCQSTSQKTTYKVAEAKAISEEATSQSVPRMKPKSKGQKAKLKAKLDYERLQSLIRVLKRFQQSGSQNPQLNGKIKMLEDKLKRQETGATTATNFARRATTAATVSEEAESWKKSRNCLMKGHYGTGKTTFQST